MNNFTESHHNMMLAAADFPHICMNLDEYISMMLSGNVFERFIDLNVDNENIAKGLYCKIFGANIWVGSIVRDGCIRVSNKEEPSVKNEMDWSPDLELKNFPKLLELKAFW